VLVGELRIISTDTVRERIRGIGQRVVAEHGEALKVLADHDLGADALESLGDGVAQTWHNEGMTRVRVSTTVDEKLLGTARSTLAPLTDAALLDKALAALLDRHRGAEIDAAYAAYDAHPPEEADAWGDLASFREAAAAS